MMTLAAASSYFDRTEVFDAYSGQSLFFCQVDPYDDSKRDAMAAYRRVMSVAVGVQIPTHKCVRIFNAVYIVSGEPAIDGLNEVHRIKFVLQAADGQLGYGSLSEFLDNAPAALVYAFPSWTKDAKEETENSDLANQFEVMLPLGTPVTAHQILWRTGIAYIVETVRRLPSDYVAATAIRLDQAEPIEATLTARTFDPAAGKYTDGAPNYVNALRVRWQSLFRYGSQLDTKFNEGDFTLALPEETPITNATRVEFDGRVYRVLNVKPINGGLIAHVRGA